MSPSIYVCVALEGLTFPMLRLHFSKAQDIGKASKPGHVGIHWIALAEYSQMSTHLCQGFSHFLHQFVIAELANSSIRVNPYAAVH